MSELWEEVFEGLEDPRAPNARRHDLHDILVIAFCTMLCGGQTCTDMEFFGHAKRELLQTFLKLGKRHTQPRHLLPDPGNAGPGWVSSSGSWVSCRGLPRGCQGVLALDGKDPAPVLRPGPPGALRPAPGQRLGGGGK